MIAPIDGLELRVDPHLANFKFAVQFGDGPVFVSPAMMDLIRGAQNEAELRFLLSHIHIKKMPDLLDPATIEMPLTAALPKW